MNQWKYTEDEPIPEQSEVEEMQVLAYSPRWVDYELNPLGIRIGFMHNGVFVSARRMFYHDEYVTVHSDDMREEMPTMWCPIPKMVLG